MDQQKDMDVWMPVASGKLLDFSLNTTNVSRAVVKNMAGMMKLVNQKSLTQIVGKVKVYCNGKPMP